MIDPRLRILLPLSKDEFIDLDFALGLAKTRVEEINEHFKEGAEMIDSFTALREKLWTALAAYTANKADREFRLATEEQDATNCNCETCASEAINDYQERNQHDRSH